MINALLFGFRKNITHIKTNICSIQTQKIENKQYLLTWTVNPRILIQIKTLCYRIYVCHRYISLKPTEIKYYKHVTCLKAGTRLTCERERFKWSIYGALVEGHEGPLSILNSLYVPETYS